MNTFAFKKYYYNKDYKDKVLLLNNINMIKNDNIKTLFLKELQKQLKRGNNEKS